MRENPEKYKSLNASSEPVKVGWTYNKIMLTHGQGKSHTMTPEMIEKLKKK